MKYIESKKIKEEKTPSTEIASMSPWVVEDGSFSAFLDKNFKKKNGSILDIGCGSGSTLKAAASYFSSLKGVDISSYLEPGIADKVDLKIVDLNFERLPYNDETFDLVTAFQVIEHLENPFLVMREAHRVLRSGGFFIVSVPNPFQLTFRVKYLLTGNMPPWTKGNNHLLFLTKDVFAKTYLENFDLIETVYQRGAIPFWGRLRNIFGKKYFNKHAMVLPRSEAFGRRVCYILRKK